MRDVAASGAAPARWERPGKGPGRLAGGLEALLKLSRPHRGKTGRQPHSPCCSLSSSLSYSCDFAPRPRHSRIGGKAVWGRPRLWRHSGQRREGCSALGGPRLLEAIASGPLAPSRRFHRRVASSVLCLRSVSAKEPSIAGRGQQVQVSALLL